MKAEAAAKRLDYLRATHASLEGELNALTKRAYLTPSEQLRTRQIKKEKLKAKDGIRVLMNEFSLK